MHSSAVSKWRNNIHKRGEDYSNHQVRERERSDVDERVQVLDDCIK